MSWMASSRYGARTTDTGAVLVQELINTLGLADKPDLLAERRDALTWWDRSVRRWAAEREVTVPEAELSDDDLVGMRRLRDTFGELLATGRTPPEAAGATVTLVPGTDGLVRTAPTGRGAQWLASACWSEILLAQQGDTWSRIKMCRNDRCRIAFYDTSRNRSGVWHDVTRCGNIANLRASRERNRNRQDDQGRR
ncbi:putative RNA-binding Zn ribbon-like protein [Micromonospora pisi]|uniref:Putative RNA-binding Zn ribbon-like protein n=1 Tax=Micromonospora pisi TaxID=589240 RepID=A0A495JEA4_9ACTN|nr:CGNR zinc finger domain-containing protein [Micromonospora pisi]RKR86399.1 putative RNA-binding Zn ribbon-like protein [Micromonospora pisi]